jgi:RHS repeat-associated protein
MLLLPAAGVYSQDYTYDGNGNLSKDTGKKIQSIHYNYLNLADTIVYDDGRKIIYLYSASGQKLQEQVIDTGGHVVKRADYLGGIVYRNDTLRQVDHENGRVVPVSPGNSASAWEYQYALKDHADNVRTLLTARQDVDNTRGTFETVNLAAEQNGYLRYDDARRINSPLFDHTKNGSSSFSERLNGSANEKYGLAKSLSVMPGDVISLEVFAKYADPDASHWQQALISLMSQIASGATGTVVDGTGYSTNGNTPFAFAGLSGTGGNTSPGPKAYLNWLVFDHRFAFRNGGFVKMDASAKENGSNVAHQRLSRQLTITEPGYVYVYLSNEEASPVDVFFDDFTVQLTKGPVVQQADYDPFGLVLNETDREHAEPNNFLYSGKELQEDFDLNWYDYGARMYDPTLGRWQVIDPKAEKYTAWSPYNYVMNNPVKFVDPDGRDGRLVINKQSRIAYIEANFYVYHYERDAALAGAQVWSDLIGKEKIVIDNVEYKLGYSVTVIQVDGQDKESLAEQDPIGNVINLTTSRLYNPESGVEDLGVTNGNVITLPVKPSATDVAHEMGHTMLNLDGPNDEHISGTIMASNNLDQKYRLNKEFVEKVRQTYGVVRNPHPAQGSKITVTRPNGKTETIEDLPGNRFKKVYSPQVSNEDVLKALRQRITEGIRQSNP